MNNFLKNLKENLIFKNLKIIEAIKTLNYVNYKTLIILDKSNKIFGTLTDGDIRRGLLRGASIYDKLMILQTKTNNKKLV